MQVSSGPQAMAMGDGERRAIATAEPRARDQVAGGPSGVAAQSCAWTRRAISALPRQASLTTSSENVRSLTEMANPPMWIADETTTATWGRLPLFGKKVSSGGRGWKRCGGLYGFRAVSPAHARDARRDRRGRRGPP